MTEDTIREYLVEVINEARETTSLDKVWAAISVVHKEISMLYEMEFVDAYRAAKGEKK